MHAMMANVRKKSEKPGKDQLAIRILGGSQLHLPIFRGLLLNVHEALRKRDERDENHGGLLTPDDSRPCSDLQRLGTPTPWPHQSQANWMIQWMGQ